MTPLQRIILIQLAGRAYALLLFTLAAILLPRKKEH
jgi:hypothetical protein